MKFKKFVVSLLVLCILFSSIPYSVAAYPSLKEGSYADWVERIDEMPSYATDLYDWFSENSKEGGALRTGVTDTLLPDTNNEYAHLVTKIVKNNISFNYDEGDTTDDKFAILKAATKDEIEEVLDLLSSCVEEIKVSNVEFENISVQQVEKDLYVSWEAKGNAKFYHVYRRKVNTKTWKEVEFTSKTFYQDDSVSAGVEYEYKIEPVLLDDRGNHVNGKMSSVVSGMVISLTKPKITMETNGTTKFNLSWNKVKGANRYIVYRKSTTESWKKIITLKGDVTQYTTSSLVPNTYTFQVKAANYNGEDKVLSKGSNVLSGTTTFKKPSITLTAGKKQIKVSWKKVEGIDKYQVYQATSKNGKYTKVKTTSTTSYTAKSLQKGKTYYYKVRGYKGTKTGKVYTSYSSVKYTKAQ